MRILLADDHTIVRDGIKMLLSEAYPFAEIVDVSDSATMLQKVMDEKWDIVISDISMPPGNSGLDAVQKIKQRMPSMPVIILSMHAPEHYAVMAMKYGASAYLTKSTATLELVKAVDQVLLGKKYLTAEVVSVLADALEKNAKHSYEKLSEREKEVFVLLAMGGTISEIAQQMELSANTISTFRARIFEKMGFANNLELIKYAVDNKMV